MENCDEQQRWRRDDEFVSRSEGRAPYGESIADWGNSIESLAAIGNDTVEREEKERGCEREPVYGEKTKMTPQNFDLKVFFFFCPFRNLN